MTKDSTTSSPCNSKMNTYDKYTWMFIGILVVFCYIQIGVISNGHEWAGDFAAYLMQAQSILDGTTENYVELNTFTMNYSSVPMAPITYPWGYPLLLALVIKFTGMKLFQLKLLNAFFYLVFLGVLWYGFGKYHSRKWLLCLVALFAFNPRMITFQNMLISDIPFLLFSTLSLFMMNRIFVQRQLIVNPVFDFVFLGLIITSSYLIRKNGVLLLGTLGLVQSILFIRHQFGKVEEERRAHSKIDVFFWVQLIPWVLFFLITWIINRIMSQGGGYLSFYKLDSLEQFLTHILYYLKLPKNFFYCVPIPSIIYIITIPLAIYGLLGQWKDRWPCIIYSTATMLILILWPHVGGIRYIFPILPFYISFTLAGLERVETDLLKVKQVRRFWVVGLPIFVILLSFLYNDRIFVNRNMMNKREDYQGPFTKNSIEMFDFIKNNTPNECSIIFFCPRIMSFMTQRKSISVNNIDDLSHGDYYCHYLDDEENDALFSEILMKEKFELVFSNPKFELIRFVDSGS